uniref:Uncharacterized protein n=1 Tax=Micrurus surinamensis TaxID=129470 RepID=A0A2D4PIB4_MICSU
MGFRKAARAGVAVEAESRAILDPRHTLLPPKRGKVKAIPPPAAPSRTAVRGAAAIRLPASSATRPPPVTKAPSCEITRRRTTTNTALPKLGSPAAAAPQGPAAVHGNAPSTPASTGRRATTAGIKGPSGTTRTTGRAITTRGIILATADTGDEVRQYSQSSLYPPGLSQAPLLPKAGLWSLTYILTTS